MTKKLLLFGLDGGTLDIIQKMGKEGKLPTFEKLMKNGVYGKLESTIPPITTPAWASMFTGLNPGNLGRVDRFGLNEKYKEDLKPIDWRGLFFWDFLSERGFKTGIVNAPGIRKIYRINGFMLSGFSKDDKIYPEDFQIEREKIPSYKAKRTSEIVKTLLTNLEKKEKVVPQLLQKDWDLLTLVLKEPDSITHFVDKWPKVKEVYKKVDEILSRILDETEDCNILIASDHGIKKVQRRIYINILLEKMDFLSKGGGISKGILSKTEEFLRKKLGSSFLKTLASSLPFVKAQQVREAMGLERIQKNKTKIFGYGARAGSYPRLWINSKKRFEKGIVEENQINTVKNDFIEKVENLKKEENPIEEIYEGPQVYEGKKARWIPDLIVRLENDCIEDYKLASKVSEKDEGFGHALKGVFMAYGPDIKTTGEELKNLSIYDIAPTILHAFDVSVPKKMDGKVLKEIFKEKSEPAKKPVERKEIESRQKIGKKVRKLKSKNKI